MAIVVEASVEFNRPVAEKSTGTVDSLLTWRLAPSGGKTCLTYEIEIPNDGYWGISQPELPALYGLTVGFVLQTLLAN